LLSKRVGYERCGDGYDQEGCYEGAEFVSFLFDFHIESQDTLYNSV
jgi:hypothetical protein